MEAEVGNIHCIVTETKGAHIHGSRPLFAEQILTLSVSSFQSLSLFPCLPLPISTSFHFSPSEAPSYFPVSQPNSPFLLCLSLPRPNFCVLAAPHSYAFLLNLSPLITSLFGSSFHSPSEARRDGAEEDIPGHHCNQYSQSSAAPWDPFELVSD